MKPVDSAGSKGVTRVACRDDLREAIEIALSASLSKHFVIEDFLDKVGAQSSADIFTVDGKLVYPAYSDQLFDKDAANPYTPAIEIWPASMDQKFQDDLTAQLQRLFSLLGVKSGIYNVESRVCSDGKAYIMEVSPRGGGNRIAEIKKALGMPLDNITEPEYDGIWCNYILHSSKEGTLVSIEIDPEFKRKYVRDVGLIVSPGDHIVPFTGANTSLGTLFLRFETKAELEKALGQIESWLQIKLK